MPPLLRTTMPNKHIEEAEYGLDEILVELSDSIKPVVEAVEQSEDHALFVLGVKYINDADHKEGVQTYINAQGFFGILEEGLYAELADQINGGHMGLFAAIRRVVRDIEEEMGISPEDELDEEDDTPAHYH